jgi:hypothetical protein
VLSAVEHISQLGLTRSIAQNTLVADQKAAALRLVDAGHFESGRGGGDFCGLCVWRVGSLKIFCFFPSFFYFFALFFKKFFKEVNGSGEVLGSWKLPRSYGSCQEAKEVNGSCQKIYYQIIIFC